MVPGSWVLEGYHCSHRTGSRSKAGVKSLFSVAVKYHREIREPTKILCGLKQKPSVSLSIYSALLFALQNGTFSFQD